jgi:two-component system, NarL family, response regulator
MAMSSSEIRVLCVDDHRLMREGIVNIIALHEGVTVIAEASSGEEAVEQFQRHNPDVILMDLQIRGMNGLEAIRAIRQLKGDARIVVLTMYQGDEDIYRALNAGAAGYVIKDSVPEDLIRVIREVYAGHTSIPPEIAAKLAARSGQATLSGRERQIVQMLSMGKRNKEIAEELGISEDTARTHIKSIFVKLNVHDRTAALTEALRRGILRIP